MVISVESRCILSPSMFRDSIQLSLRKKLTLLASVGVLLPLLVLTYLQYRSLAELQNKTKGAVKDNLRQGFAILERQMKQRLEDIGAQTLGPLGNINLSSEGEIEKHFAAVKRAQPEIEEIFVFANSSDRKATNNYAYIYSDKFVKTDQSGFTPSQSDILLLFNKAQMAQSFLDANRKYLFVHHSCPACPPGTHQGAYLFYPLKDLTRGDQNSFAGVLLNEGFVSNDLLAGSIAKILKIYHANTATSSDVAIMIRDENLRVLYSNTGTKNEYFLESNFDPPFSNWNAAIGFKNTNLDDLARNTFLHSAAVTLLVLLFLLCGVALTIRATDREARLAQAKSNFVANVPH